jgi:hypothetical protein
MMMRRSLNTAIDITYRSRSLAGVIADLAGSLDELAGKDKAIDQKRIGQIIHLAEMIEGYCEENARRLEVMVMPPRPI